MKPETTQAARIDEFHVHEALDRCYVIACLLDEHLILHPYVQQDEAVRKLLCTASDALGDAYQMIGGSRLKQNELIGDALDAAVAMALNNPRIRMRDGRPWIDEGSNARPFMPSTDWRDGGPILDTEPIISGFCGTDEAQTDWPGQWYAQLDDDMDGENHHSLGPSRLIAAMRCFVRLQPHNA